MSTTITDCSPRSARVFSVSRGMSMTTIRPRLRRASSFEDFLPDRGMHDLLQPLQLVGVANTIDDTFGRSSSPSRPTISTPNTSTIASKHVSYRCAAARARSRRRRSRSHRARRASPGRCSYPNRCRRSVRRRTPRRGGSYDPRFISSTTASSVSEGGFGSSSSSSSSSSSEDSASSDATGFRLGRDLRLRLDLGFRDRLRLLRLCRLQELLLRQRRSRVVSYSCGASIVCLTDSEMRRRFGSMSRIFTLTGVADGDDLGRRFDVTVRELGDVDEPFESFADLDEGTERHELRDLALDDVTRQRGGGRRPPTGLPAST